MGESLKINPQLLEKALKYYFEKIKKFLKIIKPFQNRVCLNNHKVNNLGRKIKMIWGNAE